MAAIRSSAILVTDDVFIRLSANLENSFPEDCRNANDYLQLNFCSALNEIKEKGFEECGYTANNRDFFFRLPFLKYRIQLGSTGYVTMHFKFENCIVIGCISFREYDLLLVRSSDSSSISTISSLFETLSQFENDAVVIKQTKRLSNRKRVKKEQLINFQSSLSTRPKVREIVISQSNATFSMEEDNSNDINLAEEPEDELIEQLDSRYYSVTAVEVDNCSQVFRARWKTGRKYCNGPNVERGLFFQKSRDGIIRHFSSELRYNTSFIEVTDIPGDVILKSLFGESLQRILELLEPIKAIVRQRRSFAIEACESLRRDIGSYLCPRFSVVEDSEQCFLSHDCAMSLMQNKIILSWSWIPLALKHTSILDLPFSSVDLRLTWPVDQRCVKFNIIPTFLDSSKTILGQRERHVRGIEVNIHTSLSVNTADAGRRRGVDSMLLTKEDICQLLLRSCKKARMELDRLVSAGRSVSFRYHALPDQDTPFDEVVVLPGASIRSGFCIGDDFDCGNACFKFEALTGSI